MGASASITNQNQRDTKTAFILITDPKARDAFTNFLLDVENNDQLNSEQLSNIEKMKNILEDVPQNFTPRTFTEMNGYAMPEEGFVETGAQHNFIEATPSTVSNVDMKDDDTISTKEQMLLLMIVSVFPLFLKSSHYQKWVDEVLADPEKGKGDSREDRLDSLFSHRNLSTEAVIARAISTFDKTELNCIGTTGLPWLDTILSAVEDIPVCFTMATARPNRPGFPLIYVNKAFERVTMYTRDEIIGQNCRFLQGENLTEHNQVAKLREALRTGTPVKVALTNYRKDGTPFKNLLALKPIYTKEGVYSYVIGAQIDATYEKGASRKIKLVSDLLSILPNVI